MATTSSAIPVTTAAKPPPPPPAPLPFPDDPRPPASAPAASDNTAAMTSLDSTSAAIVSKGEYGVPAGLVFGYPCTSSGDGNWKVVEGLKLDAFGDAKFKATLVELQKEQEVVKDLLPS